MFQVLAAVIKHVLDCSDEEVLDILRLRLPVPDFAVDDLIMQVDDATDILEAADNKELKRSQQESEEAAERDKGFAAEYAAERSKLIEAGKCHKKKHADLLKVIKGYTYTFPKGELCHAEVARMAPPSSHVWRSVGVGS